MLTEGYGAEYAATLNTYMPMWIAPILLVACFVFGLVGGEMCIRDRSKLKIMKADHNSKQFRLEDSLLKYFPEKIEEHKGLSLIHI